MSESFDIFDTILMRRVASPNAVYYLTGLGLEKRSGWPVSAAEFRRVRHEAGLSQNGLHLPHADIVREVLRRLNLAESWTPVVMEAEREVETRLLTAVPGARERLVRARASSGHGVTFISDMYFDGETLQAWLTAHDMWQEGDGIIVSCEHPGMSKSYDGSLFCEMIDRADINDRVKIHHGNCPVADGKMASKQGLKPVQYIRNNPTADEDLMERFSVESKGISSLLAGACRLTRLKGPSVQPQQGLWDMSCTSVAPLLILYTEWLLRRARSRGIVRLYFLSRDGFLPKLIAEHLVRHSNLNIELRYLYGSRLAMVPPMEDSPDSPRQSRLFREPPHPLNLGRLLARLGLTWELAASCLPEGLCENPDLNHSLSEACRQEIADTLMPGQPLRNLVDSISASRQQMLHQYLDQEKVFDGTPSGFVDLGWGGSLQRAISTRLAVHGCSAAHFFYFGCRLPAARGSTALSTDCFLYGPDSDTPEWWQRSVPMLMESFSAAPQDPVSGYEAAGGTIVPAFLPGHGKALREWGLEIVHDAVLQVTQAFCEGLNFAGGSSPWENSSALAKELLRRIALEPTAAEAAQWGDFPLDPEWSGEPMSALAPRLPRSIRNLSKIALGYGARTLDIGSGMVWHQASLALAGTESLLVRMMLRVARAKKILDRHIC